MLEKNVNDLELKLRVVKSEIRENDREKEKYLNATVSLMVAFVFSIIGCFYYKQELKTKTWLIFLFIFLGLSCLFLGFYWYNRYKIACEKIEQLEKELARLKEGLKKE